VTWLRSALFALWFFGASLVLCIVFAPTLLMPRRFVSMSERTWARMTILGLRVIAGVRHEVRGLENVPKAPCLVACKHHTAWETIILPLVLNDPTIVVKRELTFIPLYGWYLLRAGMIVINRSTHAKALRKLIADAKSALAHGRSVIIFPEGTRIAPGATGEYKPGVAALYGQLDVPCIPVALNSGVYWPKRSFIKRPGTIILEFLPPIPPGLNRKKFMAELETRIEGATNRLLAEAGFAQPGAEPARAAS
jgi:1-acyl-sn-glycerol-3-phosphate acyltransferase